MAMASAGSRCRAVSPHTPSIYYLAVSVCGVWRVGEPPSPSTSRYMHDACCGGRTAHWTRARRMDGPGYSPHVREMCAARHGAHAGIGEGLQV